ncbi:MAG: Membrane protein involved in colicin uptake [Candidatus Saccharibacteria bacterium]|nr:Membrane protein involved in colicin uptake [Candidatus Saccharibacteria bacterium]
MSETEQTTEVHETTTQPNGAQVQRHNVSRTSQTSGIVIAQRFIWFIVGVIDALIAIRFILLLLGANQSAGFVDFIYGITGILVAPFVGIFGEPIYGRFLFEWSSVLAVVVYSLIAWGIVKLITLTRPQEEI